MQVTNSADRHTGAQKHFQNVKKNMGTIRTTGKDVI